MVIDVINELSKIQGANFKFARTDYSWQSKIEYTISFEFANGGDDLRVVRVGEDFEKTFREAWDSFQVRLYAAFKPAEMRLALEHKPE